MQKIQKHGDGVMGGEFSLVSFLLVSLAKASSTPATTAATTPAIIRSTASGLKVVWLGTCTAS